MDGSCGHEAFRQCWVADGTGEVLQAAVEAGLALGCGGRQSDHGDRAFKRSGNTKRSMTNDFTATTVHFQMGGKRPT